MTNKILNLKNIYHFFNADRQRWLLEDINHDFYPGSSYAIKGPSGCGKSTLLHILAGLQKPQKGHIFIQDSSIIITPEDKKWHSYFGFVFQQPSLLNELSVMENIMLKGFLDNKEDDYLHHHARQLLSAVGLSGFELFHPKQLSIGQQHRVSLARALFNNPSFIVADEPTASLDQATARSITTLLIEYVQKHALGLIVASHDSYLVDRLEHSFLLS